MIHPSLGLNLHMSGSECLESQQTLQIMSAMVNYYRVRGYGWVQCTLALVRRGCNVGERHHRARDGVAARGRGWGLVTPQRCIQKERQSLHWMGRLNLQLNLGYKKFTG